MKVFDDYIQELKLLHQTKEYKNIEFHKFRMKEKGIWRTYWYLDNIDIKRLTKPSVLDKRIYKM